MKIKILAASLACVGIASCVLMACSTQQNSDFTSVKNENESINSENVAKYLANSKETNESLAEEENAGISSVEANIVDENAQSENKITTSASLLNTFISGKHVKEESKKASENEVISDSENTLQIDEIISLSLLNSFKKDETTEALEDTNEQNSEETTSAVEAKVSEEKTEIVPAKPANISNNSTISNVVSSVNALKENTEISSVKEENEENIVVNVPEIPTKNEETIVAENTGITSVNSDNLAERRVAIIGNSIAEDVHLVNAINDAKYYTKIGMNVKTATDSVQNAINANNTHYVINLGSNELGWYSMSVFKEEYGKLIDMIYNANPDAKIYLVSVLPVSRNVKTNAEYINNENVKKLNKAIKEVCSEKNVAYIDAYNAFADSEGYLTDESSSDGVHIGRSFSRQLANLIERSL